MSVGIVRIGLQLNGIIFDLFLGQPDLVVHSFGHARAFHGQAYLPQELPPGVTPQELR